MADQRESLTAVLMADQTVAWKADQMESPMADRKA